MFARAMLLVLVVPFAASLPGLAGCGGKKPAPAEPATKEAKSKHREHPPDKDAVSEKGKKWGGWRWKGDRADCYFIVGNKCFDTKASACKSAACGKKECVVKKGAPSKVSCAK